MRNKILALLLLAMAVTTVHASTYVLLVRDSRLQTITGFGAACCDGAMCPFGSDTAPVSLLYGKTSKIGLNIMRMEISPNFKGDLSFSDVGWDTPYDWHGSLPSAKIVKNRGGIVFGTPWSPPGSYKTNGDAQGGNSDDQGNQRGQLREDCYEKFFPWLNTFLAYMKANGGCGIGSERAGLVGQLLWLSLHSTAAVEIGEEPCFETRQAEIPRRSPHQCRAVGFRPFLFEYAAE